MMSMKALLGALLVIGPYMTMNMGIASAEEVSLDPSLMDHDDGEEEEEVVVDVFKGGEDPFEGVSLTIHRNGEITPCGTTRPNIKNAINAVNANSDFPLRLNDKYDFEHALTKALGYMDPEPSSLLSINECGPEQPPESVRKSKRESWGRGMDYHIPGVDSAFLNYCDMGFANTPKLLDEDELIEIEVEDSAKDGDYVDVMPCHYHTREGMRITSLNMLTDAVQKLKKTQAEGGDKGEEECTVTEDGSTVCTKKGTAVLELHIYAVPAGRHFMFTPSFVGEIFDLSYLGYEKPVSLEVMSLSPKVFDVINFFDKAESEDIVKRALAETSESHKIKRSSTGASGYNVVNTRTSENGFDTHGATAQKIKKRCLNVLGFDAYEESFTDGLQVLRYNKTTAYIPHMDWIDDIGRTQVHNYDSAGVGTNRFATVLLYMSDLGEDDGGETVFKNAWPDDVPEGERMGRRDALEELRKSGDASFLEKNSWEETMVADCRSRLAVRPQSARAVLFYSQFPNGEDDPASLHGGCPVLHGEKWAANLWVWNGPRNGFPGSPTNPGKEEEQESAFDQLSATFVNEGKDPEFKDVDLYFQDTFWSDYSHGSTGISVNTYEGHLWNVKRRSDGKTLKQFTVGKEKTQRFVV